MIAYSNEIEEMMIADNTELARFYGQTEFTLDDLSCLCRIRIGNHCFKRIQSFRIMNNKKLQFIEIGKDCFVDPDGEEFVLSNCPILEQVSISNDCFLCYSSYRLEGNIIDGLSCRLAKSHPLVSWSR